MVEEVDSFQVVPSDCPPGFAFGEPEVLTCILLLLLRLLFLLSFNFNSRANAYRLLMAGSLIANIEKPREMTASLRCPVGVAGFGVLRVARS